MSRKHAEHLEVISILSQTGSRLNDVGVGTHKQAHGTHTHIYTYIYIYIYTYIHICIIMHMYYVNVSVYVHVYKDIHVCIHIDITLIYLCSETCALVCDCHLCPQVGSCGP